MIKIKTKLFEYLIIFVNKILKKYNEKQYRSWYERLKKGRLNQLVKNSNNDRYE